MSPSKNSGDLCLEEAASRAVVGKCFKVVKEPFAEPLERCELGLGEPEQVTPPFLPTKCLLLVIPSFFLYQFSAQMISRWEERCARLRDLATLEPELEI